MKLDELYCANFGMVIGYKTSTPHGYIICPECAKAENDDGE